ncbi:hypothetical protein Fcan01_16271 [Folsomia candida]|uniref:Uncharacterized protein n=1 Tax=Folsomia candida TaxID=158441 RepID=A0A226DU18_FOLCA|nr:hypothetical protein Fcan01_16271 [Folsomia candida]
MGSMGPHPTAPGGVVQIKFILNFHISAYKMAILVRLVGLLSLLILFTSLLTVESTIICICAAAKCNNETDTWSCQSTGGTCQFVNQQCGFRCQEGFLDVCASV